MFRRSSRKSNFLSGILCPMTFKARHTSCEWMPSSQCGAPMALVLTVRGEKRIFSVNRILRTHCLSGIQLSSGRSNTRLCVLIQDQRHHKPNPDMWKWCIWVFLLFVGRVSQTLKICFQTARKEAKELCRVGVESCTTKMVLAEPSSLSRGSAQCTITQRKN